jgi:putative glutamine amidotransferase
VEDAPRRTSTPPVIGITCYEEDAAWGNWRTTAAVLPARYVRSLERAGAMPVLIPPQQLDASEAVQLLGHLDGLVVAGGNDIAPRLYGEDPHPETVVAAGERDHLELAVVTAAAEAEVPTLAICRGLQVMNVARGGTLIQHLPDVVGHEEHSPTPGAFGVHEVGVEDGTRLAALLSWRRARVPTHHHQAVGSLGDSLVASAYADDKVIEAVEDPGLPFFLGVQWHPEAGEDPALFEALVAAARARATERTSVG